MNNIEKIIKETNESNQEKVNWTKAWSTKYPILKQYQKEVDIKKYSTEIRKMLNSLNIESGYNTLDSMLVLKDILYHEWKDKR